jgi:hypothetical protein
MAPSTAMSGCGGGPGGDCAFATENPANRDAAQAANDSNETFFIRCS